MARVRVGHYVLGAEGLALLRHWLTGDAEDLEARLAELTRFTGSLDDGPLAMELDVPQMGVRPGYDAWSSTYDEMPNPLIRVEQPLVRKLIDRSPPGRALDAGCGTGRHLDYLRARGHVALGVDPSPGMLQQARTRIPGAPLAVASLSALPLATASVDLAVCALVLTHCPDLGPPLAELARVVRPGSRLILSDFHPMADVFGGQALFQAADGSYAFVQGGTHLHGAYLAAFRAAGLEVRECLEPRWTEEDVPLLVGPLFALAPAGFRAAFRGLPGALIWELTPRRT